MRSSMFLNCEKIKTRGVRCGGCGVRCGSGGVVVGVRLREDQHPLLVGAQFPEQLVQLVRFAAGAHLYAFTVLLGERAHRFGLRLRVD